MNFLDTSELSLGQPTDRQLQPLSSSQIPVILIVDDNQDNLQLASFIAEQLGYRVLTASRGREVLDHLTRRINLILLDIVLPDMDGFDVLHQIQQIPALGHVPVVAVTALAAESERQDILTAGFCGYLSKPYSIDSLEAVMIQYCPITCSRAS